MTKTRSYNRAMPTYEYACLSCGRHVEVYQRFSDAPLDQCGVCGGPLRKVFHPAGIQFKGSGFYATDSRSAKAKGAASGAKEPDGAKEPAGSKGEAAASASKSEPKSEPSSKPSPGSGSRSAEKSA